MFKNNIISFLVTIVLWTSILAQNEPSLLDNYYQQAKTFLIKQKNNIKNTAYIISGIGASYLTLIYGCKLWNFYHKKSFKTPSIEKMLQEPEFTNISDPAHAVFLEKSHVLFTFSDCILEQKIIISKNKMLCVIKGAPIMFDWEQIGSFFNFNEEKIEKYNKISKNHFKMDNMSHHMLG